MPSQGDRSFRHPFALVVPWRFCEQGPDPLRAGDDKITFEGLADAAGRIELTAPEGLRSKSDR